jgi:phage shock protein E
MKALKYLIPFLFVGLVAVVGASAQSVPPPSIVAPPEAWVEIQKDSVLLDVRTPEEFEKGHLKGSVLIPYDEIDARVSELGSDKTKTIVVYCASGRRAGKAAASLRTLGFTSVVNAGGYDELLEPAPKVCSNPLRC